MLVTLDVSGDMLTLRVADYGAGISPADSQRIFEPFYQTDSKQKSIGSGVGLALVKQIVYLAGRQHQPRQPPGRGIGVHRQGARQGARRRGGEAH